MPRATYSQIVNKSMSEVMTRSLVTSFSTLIGVVCLLIFGGEVLQSFAIAILVGVFSGTYSSIFIASPVLALWKEHEPTFKRRRRQQIESQGHVPAFASDLEVARKDDAEGEGKAAVPAGFAPAEGEENLSPRERRRRKREAAKSDPVTGEDA